MSLALDTSAAVDILRGRPEVRARFTGLLEKPFVSVIVVHELVFGIGRSTRQSRRLGEVDALLGDLTVVPVEVEDARAAGLLRAELKGAGTPVEFPDMLIAAQARQRGWTIVTSNLRDFGRVPGLAIVDWRVSDAPLTSAEIAERLA